MEEILYTTLCGEGNSEYTEKKSVFLGFAKQAKSEEEARELVKQIKSRYPDARHHVWAYRQKGEAVVRYSDDGEPQGSAGIPMLEVLRGMGVEDAFVGVTRYFGGILLGTGGLSRAYAKAAKDALEAAGIATYEQYVEFSLECSYGNYQKYQAEFQKFGVLTDDVRFSERVELKLALKETKKEELFLRIREMSNGADTPILLGTRFDCK